jgi:hypothetical protein
MTSVKAETEKAKKSSVLLVYSIREHGKMAPTKLLNVLRNAALNYSHQQSQSNECYGEFDQAHL